MCYDFERKVVGSKTLRLCCFFFQQDYDPKHTLLLVKDFPLKTKVNITDWPNVNATENLGAELKSITSGEA